MKPRTSTARAKDAARSASGSAAKAEARAREAFFATAQPFTPCLAVETTAGLFFVRTGDRTVGRKLFMSRRRGEMATLARAVDALASVGVGDFGEKLLVDVGANIGTTTVPALALHGFAGAVACEPAPENFRMLRINLAANDLEQRVRALPIALSDREGEADLDIGSTNSGGHHIVDDVRPGYGETVFTRVRKTTLDLLLEEIAVAPESVGLVWMDVQGHEGHVLDGASSLLRRGIPLVMELYPKWLEQAERLTAVESSIAQHYTHLLDLRTAPRHGADFEFLPTSGISELVQAYPTGFTDILACNAR